MRKHPNSHREAKATAPVLDSTPHFTLRPLNPPSQAVFHSLPMFIQP